jgi:hypothetical protein
MKTSKWIRIHPSILLEYQYNDENVQGEAYQILINTQNNPPLRSFLSKESTNNNDINYQLFQIDGSAGLYGRTNIDNYPFLQVRNYPTSIPLRYDTLRVHVPVNYIFSDQGIGFYVRIYTWDRTHTQIVDLSNHFYNITDANQSNEMSYGQVFTHDEMQWGKYVDIKIPSVTKVSDQLNSDNTTKDNTINYNLTNGVGLSQQSPVMVDFHWIESLNIINGVKNYRLSSRLSSSFPQTPEFEKFGVVIEPSNQGDFFNIYGIYNGSSGELNQFINNSIVLGNRYYLEYVIDLYEKNILVKSQKVIVKEDFAEEIEYRPIVKYSTTTAIIEVTLNLIDAVDNSKISRKATYGLNMETVSKYSRYLDKLDLRKVTQKDIIKVKTINIPGVENSNSSQFNTNSLNIIKTPFSVYSVEKNITPLKEIVSFNNKSWLPMGRCLLDLMPFDSVFKFNIINTSEEFGYREMDLSGYTNIQLSFKNDKKKIDIGLYLQSDQNQPESGQLIFKIGIGNYLEVKKIYAGGFNQFYITGLLNGSRQIIYQGIFRPWDVKEHLTQMESTYQSQESKFKPVVQVKKPVTPVDKKIEEVKEKVKDNTNSVKGVNTSTSLTPTQEVKANEVLAPKGSEENLQISNDKINQAWLNQPWKGNRSVQLMAFSYKFEKKSGIPNHWEKPGDMWTFAKLAQKYNLIPEVSTVKPTLKSIIKKKISPLSPDLDPISQKNVDLLLGYLKINNFNPMDEEILSYISTGEAFNDYQKWFTTGLNPSKDIDKDKRGYIYKEVEKGSNVPPNPQIRDLIQEYQNKING